MSKKFNIIDTKFLPDFKGTRTEGSDKERSSRNPLDSEEIEGVKYNIIPFVNEFLLILDDIKKYFYLIRTGYKPMINDNNEIYLMYKNENIISVNFDKLISIKNSYFYESVRRIFVFNWIMAVKGGYSIGFENNILVKTSNPLITKIEECDYILYVYTHNENGFNFESERNFEVPKNMLNKWFKPKGIRNQGKKPLDEFYKEAKNLIMEMDADVFRSKFSDIVNYYNPNYNNWVNVAYERFKFIKNL
jgi:hypothetical protein